MSTTAAATEPGPHVVRVVLPETAGDPRCGTYGLLHEAALGTRRQLGVQLRETLLEFCSDLSAIPPRSARRAPAPERPLVLLLECPGALQRFPWEAACDSSGEALFDGRARTLIRQLPIHGSSFHEKPPALAEPPRLLLLASRWRGTGMHAPEGHKRRRGIASALGELERQGLCRILSPATEQLSVDTCCEAIVAGRPHILHLLGHGEAAVGGSGVRLDDGALLPLARLADALRQAGSVRLLILEACSSLALEPGYDAVVAANGLAGVLWATSRLDDPRRCLVWRRYYDNILHPGPASALWSSVAELQLTPDVPRTDISLSLAHPMVELVVDEARLLVANYRSAVRRCMNELPGPLDRRSMEDGWVEPVLDDGASERYRGTPVRLAARLQTAPRGLLLVGPAGAGKTALVRRLSWQLAATTGLLPLWCPALALAVPQPSPERVAIDSVGHGARLSEMRRQLLLRELRRRLEEGRAVLVIDGLDRLALAPLTQVIQHLSQLRATSSGTLRVVATTRDVATVRALSGLGLEPLRLAGLTPAGIDAVCRRQLGDSTSALRDRLMTSPWLTELARWPGLLNALVLIAHERPDALEARAPSLVRALASAVVTAHAAELRGAESLEQAVGLSDRALEQLSIQLLDGELADPPGAVSSRTMEWLTICGLVCRSGTGWHIPQPAFAAAYGVTALRQKAATGSLAQWFASRAVDLSAARCDSMRLTALVWAAPELPEAASRAVIRWLRVHDDILGRGAALAEFLVRGDTGGAPPCSAAGAVDRWLRTLVPEVEPAGCGEPGPTLSHSDPRARIEALGRISRSGLGRHAADILLLLGIEQEAEVRAAAIEALAALRAPAGLGSIRRALSAESDLERVAAVRALGALEGLDATAELAALLHDRAWWVRVVAAETMASLGAREWAAEALSMLESEDPHIRALGATLVGAVGASDLSGELFERLDDPSPDVRVALAGALARLGGERYTTLLIQLAGDANYRVRQHALRALGTGPNAAVADHVRPALRDRHPAVRGEAAMALVRLSGDRHVDALLPLLDDARPAAVIGAIRALQMARAATHAHRIAAQLEHPAAPVREAVIEALIALDCWVAERRRG